MFSNIIIFLIILVILTLILHYSKDYKEGFFDFPDVDHNVYVQNSKDKYNELTTTINLLDPAIPVTPDSANAFKVALGGVAAKPTSTVFDMTGKTDYNIPDNMPNTFQQAQSCQSAAPTCSAFDDPTFANNCGMSFDIKGMDASGKTHIGGLFISPSDRKQQLDRAENVLSTGSAPYDPYKVYQPTLGKAKPGTFALTKDQCLVVKEKVDCAAKQTFNSPNCTQCYTSQNFARVGPETGRIPSTLFFFGSGNITITSTNNKITQNATLLDANNPIQVNVPGDSEGTVFSVVVQQPNNNPLPYIAGYIQGQTPRGTFKLDLFNLVETDQVSKAKPHINGSITVGGFRCLSMVPATGQTYMNLACIIPFSFLSMYDGDALTCDNGPIITQAASATFLESDPCFGKDNKPGNYKLECLQTRWVELGGTPQGTGWPSNQTKADAIQKDANGNPLDIDTIVDNLAPKMTSAMTGKDANGNNLSLSAWNTVSMWANGTPINTPCDGPNKDNGPLSQDCLTYLYMNQGVNSHIGPTYSLQSSQIASMKGQNSPNTYCQPGTAIDPATPAGLKFGQSLGGINAVKQTYDQINRMANDNTKSNTERAQAVQQCYGVTFDPMSTPKVKGPTQVFSVAPDYIYTRDQAPQICAKYGAQVATSAQVQEALTYGANWCACSWVSDSSTAIYPITTQISNDCGGAGLPPGIRNCGDMVSWTGGKAGVNCYGPKPGIDDYPENVIRPFSETLWDQPSTQPVPGGPQGVFTVLAGDYGGGNYNIWYVDKNLAQSTMNWTQIPGGLTTISLAPQGFMFGTNSSGAIYYLNKYNSWSASSSWIQIPGSLIQIYTDGQLVCGVNSVKNIFIATVANARAGQWTPIQGQLNKCVVYNNQLYGIGTDNKIYCKTSPEANWIATMTAGLFKDIAFDEGVVVLIGTDGNLNYADSNLFNPNGGWNQMINQPVKWNTVSLSKGSLYAIDTSGQPWYNSNYKSGTWNKVVGGNEFYPSHRMTSV
jgi:hypothetical protein